MKSHEDATVCYICGKYLMKKLFRDINYGKVVNDCHYTGKYIEDRHTVFVTYVPNEILVVLATTIL